MAQAKVPRLALRVLLEWPPALLDWPLALPD
jgi:hypothetical protein